MPYKARKLKAVDTSSLVALGGSVTDLSRYVEDEFAQVAFSSQSTEADPILFRAPPKPRRGTYVYADGTRWNPGWGEGPYYYDSNGLWVPLQSSQGTSAGANMAVNARCDIAQTVQLNSGATLASGTGLYSCDMWMGFYVNATAAVSFNWYALSYLSTPTPGFDNCAYLYMGTAPTSLANNDFFIFRQTIEGYRMAKLGWGATGALPLNYAFMFYSYVGGVGIVRLMNATVNRAFHAEFSCSAGWNFISGVVPGDVTGSWEKTTNAGIYFDIVVGGKAAAPVAPGVWTATPAFQTTNSTNLVPAAGMGIFVTGLYLGAGSRKVSSQAELAALMRPAGEELQLCKRYYEKSYSLGSMPGANGVGGSTEKVVPSNSIPIQQDYGSVSFTVQKRVAPTVTMYGFAGLINSVSNQNGGDLGASTGIAVGIGESSFAGRNNSGVAIGTTGSVVLFQWTANARF